MKKKKKRLKKNNNNNKEAMRIIGMLLIAFAVIDFFAS